MLANFIPSSAELFRILPEIILTLAATLLLILEPITPSAHKRSLGTAGFVALCIALWAAVVAYSNPGPAFQNMLEVDAFATFFRVLVILVGILVYLASFSYLDRQGAESGEFYALLLYSLTGQCLMAASRELIMIFLALEISSIATYVLAGYLREDSRASEAAIKYFLLGSFATAFFLYGVAWLYGLTGTTNLGEIRFVLANPDLAPSPVLTSAAAAMIFVGVAFKVSAAPFQVWAPDVYQGAPAPAAAFLSAGPKAAAFAVFLTVFGSALDPTSVHWEFLVWLTALATMIVGNFGALAQTNLKRLLAYSSIAHAGYVLVALAAHTRTGAAAAMFYLLAYAFMNVGAFVVVAHFAREREKFVAVDDLAGLGVRQPVTAALFTVFLLSLIGVPLTGGFFGKFYIFRAALDANLVWLTVLGLLNSAVAAYYYLRIIVVMYFREPGEAVATLPPPSTGIQAALWIATFATLFLGVFPAPALQFAHLSTELFK